MGKFISGLKKKMADKRAAEEERLASRPDITETKLYVGLTAQDLKNIHVKNAVKDVVIIGSRIRGARVWDLEAEDVDGLEGHPVVKLTARCKAEDQYCGSCGSFGCPGGC